ncbi:MAG: hypothetical protein ABSF43_17140 [Rectinemataceae bacterium]|jgi:hypothetical protein
MSGYWAESEKYEPDSTARLFLNLYSYFDEDLQKVLDELLPLMERGRTFKDAYELIVNTQGFVEKLRVENDGEETDVTIDLDTLLRDLEAANAEALRVYKANKASGSGIESVAFDAGRYEGLKQAIEIVGAFASPAGR